MLGRRGTWRAERSRAACRREWKRIATMRTWSDPTFVLDDAQTLPFTLHDVPFMVYSNDAEVLAHIERLVQRYRADDPLPPSGAGQLLIAVRGTPTMGAAQLTGVPRRSGGQKSTRVLTADIDGGRVIYRRESGTVTMIQPDAWTITGDLRSYP